MAVKAYASVARIMFIDYTGEPAAATKKRRFQFRGHRSGFVRCGDLRHRRGSRSLPMWGEQERVLPSWASPKQLV